MQQNSYSFFNLCLKLTDCCHVCVWKLMAESFNISVMMMIFPAQDVNLKYNPYKEKQSDTRTPAVINHNEAPLQGQMPQALTEKHSYLYKKDTTCVHIHVHLYTSSEPVNPDIMTQETVTELNIKLNNFT